MAATCIISIHINKGKTARQCIGERLDYIMNPKKTDGGILVSTYACSPETAADFRHERGRFWMWTINTSFLSKNEVLTGNKTAGAVKQKKVYNFLSL